ncbi:MAG: hypothetical protein V4850_35715 [Myxococcota bacterium]|jgi:hypothetical protein
MIRAFGFCNDTFDTHAHGRLCRGRERWIEGLPDTTSAKVARTVVSGAIFSDDSARDAKRGFRYSGVGAGPLLRALFPGTRIFGFCEAGDPRALPPELVVEEDYVRPLAGGLRFEPAVRWVAPVRNPEDVDTWIEGEKDGIAAPRADGFVILHTPVKPALVEALFYLVGYGDPDDRPARRYAASAIPMVLEHAKALVLLHLDKHAPALAIYSREPLESDGLLDLTARAAEAFPVPFAIPPMLARWDRALYELRMDWDPEQDGEFPVPPADDAGGRWSARRRQGGEGGREQEDASVAGEEE